MVRARNKIFKAYQYNRAGHSKRREEERQTEKEMRRQHTGMDWLDAQRLDGEGREARGMEGAGLPGHLWRSNGPPDYVIGESEIKLRQI